MCLRIPCASSMCVKSPSAAKKKAHVLLKRKHMCCFHMRRKFYAACMFAEKSPCDTSRCLKSICDASMCVKSLCAASMCLIRKHMCCFHVFRNLCAASMFDESLLIPGVSKAKELGPSLLKTHLLLPCCLKPCNGLCMLRAHVLLPSLLKAYALRPNVLKVNVLLPYVLKAYAFVFPQELSIT
jgi:hypothetical protein